MTADILRKILCCARCTPVRVLMSSGESHNVMHPEMAVVAGTRYERDPYAA